MARRSFIVNGRAIAKKVRNAASSSSSQIKDYGANCECPNCHHTIDNSDVTGSQEWSGLPEGVKFDPSDEQLIQHLAAKCGIGNSKPHAFINEFIPTIECNEGICYTHPENLPGAKKDGSSIHFFHRTTNAYSKGQRNRRKIYTQSGDDSESVRWHKTGKSTAIMENGVIRGFRKIMVLYGSSKKGCKQEASNWKMYQYHLGTDQFEENGQYVVSRIFYDKSKEKNKDEVGNIMFDNVSAGTNPGTPVNPDLPRLPAGNELILLPGQDGGTDVSQVHENVGLDEIGDTLLCKEAIDSLSEFDPLHLNQIPIPRISELEQFDFGTPLDFLFNNELPLGSQESIFDLLDW